MKIYINMVPGVIKDTFFTPEVIERFAKAGEVEYNMGDEPLGGEELGEKLENFDVLVTGWGQPMLTDKNLGNIKMIVHTAGTVNSFIDPSVFDTGVVVLSGNNYFADSVAEGVIGYMLFALRDMGKYTNDMNNGIWTPSIQSKTRGLIGKKVGIVSYGAIGKRVCKLLNCFDTKILVYSNHQNEEEAKKYNFTYASLEEIFSTCDIVSIHTAKRPETNKMINDKHFKLLKDGAVFLNTARGSVIDQDALIENLKEKRFTAVLDVYNREPLPSDSELVTLDNAILFPHQAGPTVDLRSYIADHLLDDIIRFFDGKEPINVITKEMAARMSNA